MVHENSPSSTMYADLKSMGLSNYDAALLLHDTDISFGRTALRNRITSRSQLSRAIVHVAPGELSESLFRDFSESAQMIMSRIEARAKERPEDEIAHDICEHYTGSASKNMQAALRAYGIDDNVYRNAVNHISKLEITCEQDCALLQLMLFVATGCTGDPIKAADEVERFSETRSSTTFRTPEVEIVHFPESNFKLDDYEIGLARIVDGKLKGTNAFYRVSPTEEGTEIGTLASTPGAITDVDEDVSRHHARVFKHDSNYYIIGMNSTNGTTVIAGDDKQEHVVEPPKRERPQEYTPQPFQIFPTDTICLSASTRFMVLPFADE